ncbi:MAG: YraN family protein [Myxococcota bacterium]
MTAEGWVAHELTKLGWSVVATNFRGSGAELDVIAVRDGVVRFVEVKARQAGDDSGWESIGPRKQRRLVRAAETWLARQDDTFEEMAFLVALVQCGPGPWSVEWWDDAFDG